MWPRIRSTPGGPTSPRWVPSSDHVLTAALARAVTWGLTSIPIERAFAAAHADPGQVGVDAEAARRLSRLVEGGYLRQLAMMGEIELFTATTRGARMAGLEDWRTSGIGWTRQPHAHDVALCAAALAGVHEERLVSERMMRRDEAVDAAQWSVRVRDETRFTHRPDFALCQDNRPPIAFEVERTGKNHTRLLAVLSAYRRAVHDHVYSEVVYVTTSSAITQSVERAAIDAGLTALRTLNLPEQPQV